MWFEVETLPVYEGQKVREVTIRTQCISLFYVDPINSHLMVQDNNDEHYKVISIPSINPTNNTPILGPTREQFNNFMILADSYDSGHQGVLLKDYYLGKTPEEMRIMPKSLKDMLKGIEFEEEVPKKD